MTATPSDVQTLAAVFLTFDVLAIDSATAGRLLPLVQGIAAGTENPTTLQAVLGVEQRAHAPVRTGKPSTAVIELRGVLSAGPSLFTMLGFGTSMRDFMRNLRVADADPDVTTIAIHVESPGGSAQLIPEAAALVREVRTRKLVIGLVAGCCCSAAYWVVSNATRIVTTQSGVLGSLGVIGERVSVARRLVTEGVDVALFTSSPAKAWGHPATVLTDEERAHLTARVTETAANLDRDVAQGRRVSLDVVRTRYGAGRTFSASEALTRGMVDAVTFNLDRALGAEVEGAGIEAALTDRRAALSHAALSSARAKFARVALAPHRAALAALMARREGA
jgi:ClpP class serine protease